MPSEVPDPNQSETSGDVIALVGYMGSGKSSVGRVLARLLDREFVDLDHEIERRTGKSIAEIFSSSGESGFRAIETECLRDELTAADSGRVVSCGGGIVERDENRSLLRTATTVFIYEDLDILFGRTRNAKRPLRGGDRREFEERYLRREPLYEQVSDYTVSVGGRGQWEVSREVENWLER